MRRTIACIPLILVVFAGAYQTGLVAQTAGQETRLEQKDVPKAVLEAFHRDFPGAVKPTFVREMENGEAKYEISFTQKGKKKDASYSEDGTLMEVEEEIGVSEVPQKIIDLIKSKTTRFKILRAEKVKEGDFEGYELLIEFTRKGQTRVREVRFDAAGNKVKRGGKNHPEKEN